MIATVRVTRWEGSWGFVSGFDGSDAFLHRTMLPAGHEPTIGERLRVEIGDTPRGPRVLEVLDVLEPGIDAPVRGAVRGEH